MRFSGAVAIHIQPNTLYTGNLQPSVTAFHGTRAVRTTPDRFTSSPPAYAESSELNTDRHKWGTCCTKKYSGPKTRSTWGGGGGEKNRARNSDSPYCMVTLTISLRRMKFPFCTLYPFCLVYFHFVVFLVCFVILFLLRLRLVLFSHLSFCY